MAKPERVLMTGNEAAGEAAIRAGCRHYFGYPITPQNELTGYMAAHMPRVGGTFIQAESEVAAINMCFGCAAAGRRVMTSSSSPGISLKQEGISYAAGAHLPMVIINVMRGGPGLGSIDPAQGDYFQAVKGGGHGDYHILVLAPCSVEEFAYLTALAFDLADLHRIPVMLLSDGRIGQMMEPCAFPMPEPRDLPEKDFALTGAAGRERRIVRSFWLNTTGLPENCRKLEAKYRDIAEREPRWDEYNVDDADVVCVAYGTAARVCLEAARSGAGHGLKLGLIRPITLWPFPVAPIQGRVREGKRFLVVEMSMGQMVEDVRLTVNGGAPVGFVGKSGGQVPTVAAVLEAAGDLAKGAQA